MRSLFIAANVVFVSVAIAMAGATHAAPLQATLEQTVPGTIDDVDATRILWTPPGDTMRIRVRGQSSDVIIPGAPEGGTLTTDGAIWSTGEWKNGAIVQ